MARHHHKNAEIEYIKFTVICTVIPAILSTFSSFNDMTLFWTGLSPWNLSSNSLSLKSSNTRIRKVNSKPVTVPTIMAGQLENIDWLLGSTMADELSTTESVVKTKTARGNRSSWYLLNLDNMPCVIACTNIPRQVFCKLNACQATTENLFTF